MRLSEAFDLYKQDVIDFRNLSYSTEEQHYGALKLLVEFLGDIDVETLTFSQVRDWKHHIEKNRSPRTVRGYIIKLRVVLGYLSKIGLSVLDTDLIPVPKVVDSLPTFMSSEQVSTLIKQTRGVRAKAIISLLYASGIRVSELCAMNIGDIHDRSFTVVGKGGKARLCFLDKRAEHYIDKYLATRTDNNPALFISYVSKKRMTPGNVQTIFRNARDRGKADNIHPHVLRHSFATNLLKNNTNMRYVQVMLGHQSLQTTQMYTHVVDEDLRAIYEKHHTI